MDLPVITPMLTLHKRLNWREYVFTNEERKEQTSWFTEPVIIKQDQELVDYIKNNHIQHAIMYGDIFFSQYVTKVNHGPVDFIIWNQNRPFNFEQLVTDINNEIAANLSSNGVLYLAINKFLCVAPVTDISFPDDYDDAILEYLKNNVHAVVEHHFVDRNTAGTMFNWIHPLTRFYFRK